MSRNALRRLVRLEAAIPPQAPPPEPVLVIEADVTPDDVPPADLCLTARACDAAVIAAHLGGWLPGADAWACLYAAVDQANAMYDRAISQPRPFSTRFGAALSAAHNTAGVPNYHPWPPRARPPSQDAFQLIGQTRWLLTGAFDEILDRHPDLNWAHGEPTEDRKDLLRRWMVPSAWDLTAVPECVLDQAFALIEDVTEEELRSNILVADQEQRFRQAVDILEAAGGTFDAGSLSAADVESLVGPTVCAHAGVLPPATTPTSTDGGGA